MPSPCPSYKQCQALANSSVSSCSTQCPRSLASHGCRIARRIAASSRVPKNLGAHASARLATRLGTPTSHGPSLKQPPYSCAGMSPAKRCEPGWRQSMAQAKPCVSWRTNSPGPSMLCSNATQPLIWSHACAPQGAARVSPTPHSTRQGCACPGRT